MMENQKHQEINRFTARGVVMTINHGQHGNKIRVVVKERRKTSFLDLQLDEKSILDSIKIRDYVMVEGYTRAFQFYNDALEKESSAMYFVATKIVKDVPELDRFFGISGGHFYGEAFFQAYISGTIIKTERNGNDEWANLTVETVGGGSDLRLSRVRLAYRCNQNLPLFDYLPGDRVFIRASVNTPERNVKRRHETERVFYQNLSIEDIAFESRVERKQNEKIIDPYALELPNETNMIDLPDNSNTVVETSVALDELPVTILLQPESPSDIPEKSHILRNENIDKAIQKEDETNDLSKLDYDFASRFDVEN